MRRLCPRCAYAGKITAEGSMWDAVVDVQY
jgi:hypothetical protein